MMSVLPDGVLNRVLIRELQVPATIATIILAMTAFVAPVRIWFGQISDSKRLWGYHRTGYVWLGIVCMAILSLVSVQVMWQLHGSLQAVGWSTPTYAWTGVLTLVFGLYGLAVSLCATPFATLLVDVTDEDNRSQVVAIDWSMLLGGIIVGAITIGILLKKLPLNAPPELLQSSINRLFFIVPAIAIVLALIGTWGVEKKYSHFQERSSLVNQEEKITLGRAWQILTASRQTLIFFIFLLMMTMGLFMQDPILEPYGGDVFNMEVGATATLNAFWGTGTLIGIAASGFLLVPHLGKRQTAKLGCLLVIGSLVFVILSGYTHSRVVLQIALVVYGLASGVLTSGALTLMLDLTAAETAGTFIGAWGLSQALARGLSKVAGGGFLDLGKQLFPDLVLAYGLVFALQIVCMVVAVSVLQRVNVQEFRTNAREAIAAVMENELD
jgi:BCD family chlorophyll transporter-like MFS transporter